MRIVPSQIVEFIDAVYPDASGIGGKKQTDLGQHHQPYLEVLLSLIDRVPLELIVLSPPEQLKLLIATSGIRAFFQKWRDNKLVNLGSYKGLDGKHVVSVIRDSFAKCKDEAITTASKTLGFIRDRKFRTTLQVDISSVQRAFSNGEWKAATVLAGSVIEALLLWRIRNSSPAQISRAVANLVTKARASGTPFTSPPSDVTEWKLYQMIAVARELQCIEERTAKQIDLARDFRNLIHPAKALRDGNCSQATANAALAGMYFMIDDLP